MRLGLLPTWAPSVPVMSQWLKLGGVPAPVDQWFTARYVHLAMIGPLWRRRMGFRRIYCVEVKTKYRCKLLWIGDCRCILTVVRLLETLCELVVLERSDYTSACGVVVLLCSRTCLCERRRGRTLDYTSACAVVVPVTSTTCLCESGRWLRLLLPCILEDVYGGHRRQ